MPALPLTQSCAMENGIRGIARQYRRNVTITTTRIKLAIDPLYAGAGAALADPRAAARSGLRYRVAWPRLRAQGFPADYRGWTSMRRRSFPPAAARAKLVRALNRAIWPGIS
jgi:hypothetical protein